VIAAETAYTFGCHALARARYRKFRNRADLAGGRAGVLPDADVFVGLGPGWSGGVIQVSAQKKRPEAEASGRFLTKMLPRDAGRN